jgi:hypothetical protein
MLMLTSHGVQSPDKLLSDIEDLKENISQEPPVHRPDERGVQTSTACRSSQRYAPALAGSHFPTLTLAASLSHTLPYEGFM